MNLTEEWLTALDGEAKQRTAMKNTAASHRPLSEGSEIVGLVGECQFGCEFNLPLINWERKPAGDSGHDFIVPVRFTLDVKTARNPLNLLVEQHKVLADIYALAGYSDDTKQARLLGWEWKAAVLRAPVSDRFGGVMSHYIPAEDLRPMEELHKRVMRLV